MEDSLNLGGQNLRCLMLKISYACCLGLSSVISMQFTLEMCVTAWNHDKKLKAPYIGVEGRSMSSMSVSPESLWAVLVMISSKSVTVCNHCHARWVSNGKMTNSYGYPSFTPLFEGSISPTSMKFGRTKTRASTLWYGENQESLSHLGLVRYLVVVVMPGHWGQSRRTDRITIAGTC